MVTSARWAAQLAAGQFRRLFERLPGTMMFVKDRRFRLRMGNAAFVARCGLDDEEQLVGKTDEDLFPAALAAKYRRDDEQVLASGEPLHDLIELFPNPAGSPEWSITDKLPLLDRRGRVCGVFGTVRSYEDQHAALRPYLDLASVADHLKAHFDQPLDLAALAQKAGLSTRQLSRKFRATFHMTPRSYLMQLRVIRACALLAETDRAVTEVAQESGFYDHADLARHFLRRMGMTATAYRQSCRN